MLLEPLAKLGGGPKEGGFHVLEVGLAGRPGAVSAPPAAGVNGRPPPRPPALPPPLRAARTGHVEPLAPLD